ncbi:MAG: ATP-binding protein [Parerythrobacter sp.]
MAAKHFSVAVQEDHLERLASARPTQALAELIWNALDAEATKVSVKFDESELGMRAIRIRDNGHGFPYEDAEGLFGRLGGSWKAQKNRSKTKARWLHGKEGRGRFKALALGRTADWRVKHSAGNDTSAFQVGLIRDNLVDVRVSNSKSVPGSGTGVEVTIGELHREFRSLKEQTAFQELSEIFALYLIDYPDVEITYRSERLDPEEAIASREKISMPNIEVDGETYSVELEIVEWRSATERVIYYCDRNGLPLQRRQPRFHTPGYQFSAYLKSSFVSKLNEEGILELSEMNSDLEGSYEIAQNEIKAYFKRKDVETARSEIEQWKSEEVYPFKHDPRNLIEEAERQVFDIVALNVNQHLPEFSESGKRSKAFQLRMLRQAIEKGPKELQLILTEVLDLPERKQNELAKLLEEASLASVISASKLVADRLKFITGLDALLFDPQYKKALKERSQLHKILADDNTWIIGEEFNLTVNDQSLTEVLRKHKQLLDDGTVIDRPVKRIDGRVGIVDLMLSRAVPQNRPSQREHLVIELKRPSVKIGMNEIAQIKSYAFAVSADERFASINTKWSFWVVSNELDAVGRKEARQADRPPGQVYRDDNIEVWCKTWSEIIDAAKARLKFVEDHLQTNIDRERSLKYLRDTYEKYLSGIVEDISTDDVDEFPGEE